MFGEHVARENAVHGCVLHVHVKVFATHCDNDVEVELQFVTNATFDAEVVGFSPCPPGAELGYGKESAEYQYEEGPLAAAAGGGRVGWLCFRCRKHESAEVEWETPEGLIRELKSQAQQVWELLISGP